MSPFKRFDEVYAGVCHTARLFARASTECQKAFQLRCLSMKLNGGGDGGGSGGTGGESGGIGVRKDPCGTMGCYSAHLKPDVYTKRRRIPDVGHEKAHHISQTILQLREACSERRRIFQEDPEET